MCCTIVLQVTRAEYLLLWGTFIAIMEFELEMGVAVGMLLCIIFFTVTYAKVKIRLGAAD